MADDDTRKCPDCGTPYVPFDDAGHREWTRDCKCDEARAEHELHVRKTDYLTVECGLPRGYLRLLKQIRPMPAQHILYQKLIAVRDACIKGELVRGVLAEGKPGVGKTFLLTATLCEVAATRWAQTEQAREEHRPAVFLRGAPYYISTLSLDRALKATFGLPGGATERLLERLSTAGLLVLDDVGLEQRRRTSDYFEAMLFEILDYRYRFGGSLVTCIAIADAQRLLDYGPATLDRLREMTERITVVGASQRDHQWALTGEPR